MPLADFDCPKCKSEYIDVYVEHIDLAVICKKCSQMTIRKVCQGSYMPFKPYTADYLEDEVEITSFGEKRRIHKEAGVAETDKRDNKASKGLDGWPKGRHRVATVIDGRLVHHEE